MFQYKCVCTRPTRDIRAGEAGRCPVFQDGSSRLRRGSEITVGISEISGGPKIDLGGGSVVFGAPREPHIPTWVPPRDSEVFLVAVFDLAVLSAAGGPGPPEFS